MAKKSQEQKHQEYVTKINTKYDKNIVVVGQFIDLVTSIEHYCIKHNNIFYAHPTVMLYQKGRKGCLECSNKEKWTYLRLITALALLVFSNGTPKFLLLTSEKDFIKKYNGVKTRIRLRCSKDGYEWEVSINNLINGETGCARCSGNEEWTYLRLQEAISEIKFPDGTPKYQLLTSEDDFNKTYEGVQTRIRLRCTLDGYEWEVSINNVINNESGCSRCSNREEWTYLRLQEAISELRFPDGSQVCTLEMTEIEFLEVYEIDGAHAKIFVRCAVDQDHTWWVQITNLINNKTGCPDCNTIGSSKVEIEWIEFVMANEGIHIQYALNGGQVKINGRLVDGMCYETNSVYQFHGDYWHGNPNRYEPDYINPSNYKRMGDLYEETLIKDQELRDQGYNVIIIWESEWNEIKKNL